LESGADGLYEIGMHRPHSAQVLVIDDDADTRELVCRILKRAGLDTAEAQDGQDGLRKLFTLRPDLVLLDVVMPGMDGIKTLERIRDLSQVPVLMLTGKADTELEMVQGLQSGADDYVTKPFGRQELVARVQALLRRSTDAAKEAPEQLSDSLVTIDFGQASVTVNGVEVSLTPLEFRLMATFARNSNQVLNHAQLLEEVWGASGDSRDQVKLYVGYLRRKLREAGAGDPIETVRGFGYRYRPRAA
jgi:DNA-binding response OmpR family regulator